MAKKRKRAVKAAGDKAAVKPKAMKDPNPANDDYMHDEVDRFHRGSEKILLNPRTAEEQHGAELEEDFDDEVLALKGDSSSDEEEDDGDNSSDEDGNNDGEAEGNDGDNIENNAGDTSSEDEDNVEKGLPSDKAWGRNKKNFYDADVDDDDVYSSGEEAELAAEEEEEEAKSLQKRLAEQLDTQDFYTFDEPGKQDQEEIQQELGDNVAIPKDLSKLSRREKLEILAKESPELLPLLNEFAEKVEEVKTTYHPLLLLARRGLVTNADTIKYIEIKHQLLLNYLVNVSFYLALKSGKENTKGHPVIDVLVQHQQLLAQMKPFDEKLQPEITEFLQKHNSHLKETFTAVKSGKTSESHVKSLKEEMMERKPPAEYPKLEEEEEWEEGDSEEDGDEMDPLKYYNLVKAQYEKQKQLKKKRKRDNLDDDDKDDGEVEEEEELDGEGKRMITYEMSKNKGLIRKRRKELKNPRVKHKVKYKKAIIKRKGQVREVQNEMNRYGGETTGIKSTLSRSVKIK